MGSSSKTIFRAAIQAHLEELRAELWRHPPLMALQAFETGRLTSERSNRVSEHLAICESCRSKLGRQRPRTAAESWVLAPEIAEWVTREEQDRAWASLSRCLSRRSSSWRSLSCKLKEGPTPVREVISLAQRLAQALAKVHMQNGVIRDLRPENVFLDPEQKTVRLLDLGIVGALDSLEAGQEGLSVEDLNNSLRCSSPEQILRENLDQRSNLFSLGALLYELATGVAPFRGPTPMETAGRVVALEVPAVSSSRGEIPRSFDQLIGCLLEKEPAARPGSAIAVAAALAAIEAGDMDPLRMLEEQEPSETEIEKLYRRIGVLMQRKQEVQDEALESEIEACMGRLRTLQRAEAERFRAAFDERLAMPINAGKQILDRAETLRKKLEDFAASNPSAH